MDDDDAEEENDLESVGWSQSNSTRRGGRRLRRGKSLFLNENENGHNEKNCNDNSGEEEDDGKKNGLDEGEQEGDDEEGEEEDEEGDLGRARIAPVSTLPLPSLLT